MSLQLANSLCIKIATDFSKTPGPRTKQEGLYSAEEFRESILLPRFDEAIAGQATLLIDLDGGFGYGTSFLEESFGGLARLKGPDLVSKHLKFKSEEEPYLVKDIERYISRAKP